MGMTGIELVGDDSSGGISSADTKTLVGRFSVASSTTSISLRSRSPRLVVADAERWLLSPEVSSTHPESRALLKTAAGIQYWPSHRPLRWRAAISSLRDDEIGFGVGPMESAM